MKVLIIGVNTRSGLAMVRHLARQGFEVIGADHVSYPYDLRSRHIKRYYSFSCEDETGIVEQISGIVEQEKPEVLIPLKCSRELHRHRKYLDQVSRVLLPDQEAYLAADDNARMLEQCAELGIPAPRVLSLDDAIALIKGDEAQRVVVKPRVDVGGARGVHIVDKVPLLEKYVDRVGATFGDAIISEYVPGPPTAMRSLNLLFDRGTTLRAAFTYSKIRQWPVTGGIVGSCVSVHETQVIDMVLPFFRKWNWRGPAEVEYKWDARDKVPRLIEINPRYSGNISFALSCGIPFGVLHCQAAVGNPLPDRDAHQYRDGIKGLWFYFYLKSVLREFGTSRSRMRLLASELAMLRRVRLDLADNLLDIAPVAGFILKVLKDRKKTG
ncbi:MAG TPA: hypothetical protein ENK05_05670 [Gammaproteobacteria bacterium]|nr:hypothetical protein [Gammaproteobacteria bacterium]